MSYTAMDTSSKITTNDLKKKKEIIEGTEIGKDASANRNTNEEKG